MCPFVDFHAFFYPSHDLEGRGMSILENPVVSLFPKVPRCVDSYATESSLAIFGDRAEGMFSPVC